MTLNLKELIKLLDTNDPKAIEFKKRVISSLNDADKLGSILEQHCENQKQTNCYYCDDEGACLAIRGVAHLNLKKAEDAIKHIENANVHFRGRDETWNSIIGLELLGIAYEMRGKRHQALLEYQQALQLLKKYWHAHKNDYDLTDKIEVRESKLDYRLQNPIILSAGTPTIPVAPIPTALDSAPKNDDEPENYLSIPWIPIYENMQAGANGLNWDIPPNQEKTELNQVRLQGKQCIIHAVHGGKRRVVLNSERQYAWGKVRGHSMEEATPTPICENDYVLFYRADAANNDSIVIVAQHGSGASDSCLVKRIDLDNKLLFSQTNRKGAEYEPISFQPNQHQIVGVVVAVAKPLNGKTSSPS